MFLSEFAKLCGDRDLDLVIKVQADGFGPTPAVGIMNVLAGFDWDHGKLIIIPEKPLVPGTMPLVECGKRKCVYNKDSHCTKDKIRIGNPSGSCMDLDEPGE